MAQHKPDPCATLGLLSPALETALGALGQRVRLQKKSTLFCQGSQPDALYRLQSGILRLSVTASNGREAVLSVMQAERWFGEASLLGQEPRAHDARAVTDCELLAVPAPAVHELLDERPDFLRELTRLICRRYRLSLQRIDATILLSVPVRVAMRLLAVNDVQHPRGTGPEAPTLRLSQEELSQMLGVSRQSVNKVLKDWEARHIVRVSYGRITLLDPDTLRALV
ncbi:Crp/Fnr family transcriptional regulator [Bordetella hinzii]|nr:Crp/Fnr family transcriptional regulator [Bordetella hinzii]